MGRMLETMQRGSRVSDGAASETLPPEQPSADVETDASNDPAEDIPYIEVGGRGMAVDASPLVLKAPEANRPPEQLDRKIRLDQPVPRAPLLHAAPPREVRLVPVAPAEAPAIARVAPEVIAFHDPIHPVSEQYRALLSAIQGMLPMAEPPMLLFTAISPGAGTTTALLNLAVTWCRQGKQRIVVVDANLARPTTAKRLGILPALSLAEVLRGRAVLEQALHACSQTHLYLLAAPAAGKEMQLLSEENVRWLAARLRERFDVVLVDGPAWESSSDAATLAAVADGVYLIVDGPEKEDARVTRATRALARAGRRLGGIIVSQ
jgi:Mrp family chromosome partitioning ATPase